MDPARGLLFGSCLEVCYKPPQHGHANKTPPGPACTKFGKSPKVALKLSIFDRTLHAFLKLEAGTWNKGEVLPCTRGGGNSLPGFVRGNAPTVEFCALIAMVFFAASACFWLFLQSCKSEGIWCVTGNSHFLFGLACATAGVAICL